MKQSAAVRALAALARTGIAVAAALIVSRTALAAQTAPPVAAASTMPAMWRPLIVVDPRHVLRASQHHHAAAHEPARRPRSQPSGAPGAEVFEQYDTAPPRRH